jgi:hypothetical protein
VPSPPGRSASEWIDVFTGGVADWTDATRTVDWSSESKMLAATSKPISPDEHDEDDWATSTGVPRRAKPVAPAWSTIRFPESFMPSMALRWFLILLLSSGCAKK